jgi:leader peptidase (prepilin peptidase)/N-methyltransferase
VIITGVVGTAAGAALCGLSLGPAQAWLVERAPLVAGRGSPFDGLTGPAAGRRAGGFARPAGSGSTAGPAVLLGTATGVGWAAAAAAGASPALPAQLVLIALGVVLVPIDVLHHRLPDVLVLPAYPLVFGLLTVAAAAEDDRTALVRSATAATVSVLVHLVMAWLPGGGLGLGDVKLAGLLGLVLGWTGWSAVLWSAVLSFGYAAAAALVLIGFGRASGRTPIAFGPAMVAGAVTVLLS